MNPDSHEMQNGSGPTYRDWKHWEQDRFGTFTANEDAYFTAELGPIFGEAPIRHVLEIGFGNGALLGWCLERGIQYCGVEVDSELVMRARARGICAYSSLRDPELAVRAGALDVVLAIDVFEHVHHHDLIRLLDDVWNLLRVGGKIIARFPNGDSPFGRLNQYGDMTHVTVLGRDKVVQLASLTGFRVTAIEAPATALSGCGPMERLRLAAGLLARSLIERVCASLYFSGRRVPFAPNYVAVLCKIEASSADES